MHATTQFPVNNFGSRIWIVFLCLNFIFFLRANAQSPQDAQGVDVSDNNSASGFSLQEWQTIKNAFNLKFAYSKATEGKTYQENSFSTNISNSAQAGLITGAYHFARPDDNQNAADEANFFLQIAGQYIGANHLPPALDLEDIYDSNGNLIASPAAEYNPQQLTNWVLTWLSTVEKSRAVAPILYVDGSYATNAINLKMLISPISGKAYQIWIADPSNTYQGSWLFKQYSGKNNPAPIQGFKYGFDRDQFYSDGNALSTFVAENSNTALPDLSITAGTQSVVPTTVVAGANVTVSCSEDNSGDATSGANDITLWLSKDGVLTGSDTYLGQIPFTSSVVANSNTLINSTTVQIPPGTPAGTYYLFFWADGNQIIPESDETNNFASQIITVTNSQQVSLALTLVPQCNGTSSGITLNWNIVAGATSYNIYRGGSLYTSIAGTQFNNTNVTAGQSYSYYVVAQMASANVTSNTASSTAPNCSTNLPGAFALTVTSGCSGNSSQIVLNWSTSNNATTYDIYRNNGLYAPGQSGIQFSDNSISAGQTYNYYVIAKNAVGNATSNAQSATAQNCSVTVLPGTPALTLTPVCNGTSSQMKLDWTATANTSAYDIYKNNSYYTTVTSNAEYVDDLITAGLVYTYYVRATNGSDGTNSGYQSATATNCTSLPLPAKPALVIHANCAGGITNVSMSWAADNNTNSYDIYRNYTYYATVADATQFTDYAVTLGSIYLYYVEAKNNIGSTDSDIQSTSIPDCTPNFPSAPVLTVTPLCNGNSGQVTLDWTTSNNAVAYDIYRDNVLIYTAFNDTREYIDNTASSGSNHSYYVAAGNGSGLTNSNNISIAVPNCVPTPSIASITPLTAESGTMVTINGANFDNTTTVTFGGVPAQSVTIVSPTKVQAVVSTGATGNVVITNQGGAATFSGFQFIFNLPPNNFSVSTTSATCKGTANGSININSNQVLNYTATVTGSGLNLSNTFTVTDTIGNLAAGTYHICISVDGQFGYQQCYDVIITEPKDLSVYSTVNNSDNTLSLTLSGGNVYNIQLNGSLYTTTDNSITLPLKYGDNQLSVTTDKLCQGTYQTVINILKAISPFPEPFENSLSVNLGPQQINSALFEVHNTVDGKVLYSKQFNNQAGVIQLDLSSLTEGVYILHIKLDNIERIFKIIKK